jgi:hypothetical protein
MQAQMRSIQVAIVVAYHLEPDMQGRIAIFLQVLFLVGGNSQMAVD